MGKDISVGRNIIDFFGESITKRCNKDQYPIQCIIKEPSPYRTKSIWDNCLSGSLYDAKNIVDKVEKYTHRYELGYGSDHKEFFCGEVSLEYSYWYIEKEGNCIGNSEKYSDERHFFELKGKEKYNRKVKDHPNESLESIGEIKILEFMSIKRVICRDYHHFFHVFFIGSSIFYFFTWC